MNTVPAPQTDPTATKYEVVLVWSHGPTSDLAKAIDQRKAYAYNRVFDQEPSREALAGIVAAKQAEIEANPLTHPDPAFHRLEVRKVTTELADLESLVAEYNENQPA